MQQIIVTPQENLSNEFKTQLLKLYNEFFPRKSPRPQRTLNWIDQTSKNRIRFILFENQTLVSHAAILVRKLIHAGNIYNLAGLGGVLTRTEYQKKGYGTEIVKFATEYIYNHAFDIAILFCHRNKEAFYRLNGWEILKNDSTIIEEDNPHPQPQDELTMIQYVSHKAKGDKVFFEEKPIFFGESW